MTKAASENPIFKWAFARIYPMYVQKAEKKGRTKAEVDQIITWLFGYDDAQLGAALADETTLEDFVTKQAPKPNSNRELITGVVCGVRVEEVADPVMREVRYLDKLVDELAHGKAMDKILRS